MRAAGLPLVILEILEAKRQVRSRASLCVGSATGRSHALETEQRVLFGDLARAARSGASGRSNTPSSWRIPSGSWKISLLVGRARWRPRRRAGGSPRSPSDPSGEATRCTIAVTIPAPARPGSRARILEEGDVGAGRAVLVGVVEVVDARVVLVDGLLDQAQSEHARRRIDVGGCVAGDQRDVVDAFDWLHGGTFGRRGVGLLLSQASHKKLNFSPADYCFPGDFPCGVPVHHLLQRHDVPGHRPGAGVVAGAPGVERRLPLEQTCCGRCTSTPATRAETIPLVRRFVQTFADSEVVVSPSASCVGMVRDYYPRAAELSGDAGLQAEVRALAPRVLELTELLVDRLGVEDVGAFFPHRVTYHPTCHSLRMLHLGDRPLRLLRAVRGSTCRRCRRPPNAAASAGRSRSRTPTPRSRC